MRYPQYLASNELTALGRKTLLDRYARKAPKTAPVELGDLVILCTDKESGQREIGSVIGVNNDDRTVNIRAEDGEEYTVDVEEVDKPLETDPQDVVQRVARALSKVEEKPRRWENIFKKLMGNWKFVPAGRILTGAGIQQETPLTFFNCNVIPAPKDSREGIIDTAKILAELFSRGAGVGTYLSSLRPRFAYVKGVNGRSSGAVSWGSLYSHLTGLIEQGGCVTGETLVATSKGDFPIKNLVGTTPDVYSYDCSTERTVLKTAKWVGKTGDSQRILRLTTTQGLILEATPDHLILCADKKYRPLQELEVGTALNVESASIHHVQSVEDCGEEDVYDLEVPDTHNFFVFSKGCKEGVFIHNSRRGAAMLVLHVWHPDVYEFIECKREPKAKQLALLADKLEYGFGLTEFAQEARDLAGQWPAHIQHANLSVGITDDFMEAVIHDRDWQLVFPDTTVPEYTEKWDGDLKKWQEEGHPIKVHKVVKARDLWNKLMYSAWDSAEPGVIYIDTVNSESTSWWYCNMLATNPCGEQPLPSWYGVCNLGAINLPRFLMEDPDDPNKVILDKEAYKNAIHVSMRFLDNVIDTTPYFFDEQEYNAKRERRVGLSPFMGLAEALVILGIRYGSEEAVDFVEEAGLVAASESLRASVDLAEEKGCCDVLATPEDREKFLESLYVQRILRYLPPEDNQDLQSRIREHGARNVSFTTSAPTGTIGTMVATSTGIEPFFRFEYRQNTNLGTHIKRERVLDEWYRQHGESAAVPDYFVSAGELTPKEHLVMTAALQRWIDSGISKTYNLPQEYTPEDIGKIYMEIWKRRCKGGTVFREGSRTVQVLESLDPKEKKTFEMSFPEKTPGPPKGDKKDGSTWSIDSPSGTLHATFNQYPTPDNPFETFLRIGKAGSDVGAMTEAFGRVISLFLQMRGPIRPTRRCELLVEQLEGIGGRDQVGFGPNKIRSIPDAIAKSISRHLQSIVGRDDDLSCSEDEEEKPASTHGLDMCPECGNLGLRSEEGCTSCAFCGYSKC